MAYSPKLKKAMEEIKAVLSKHDIAGSVILHTPGHGEHLFHIETSYSCAWHEAGMIRLRARLKEDFKGNKELMMQRLTDTINMLVIMQDLNAMHFQACDGLIEKAKKNMDIENSDGGYTDHTTQNN